MGAVHKAFSNECIMYDLVLLVNGLCDDHNLRLNVYVRILEFAVSCKYICVCVCVCVYRNIGDVLYSLAMRSLHIDGVTECAPPTNYSSYTCNVVIVSAHQLYSPQRTFIIPTKWLSLRQHTYVLCTSYPLLSSCGHSAFMTKRLSYVM